MCKKLIKNSQPFGKKFQKTVGGIFFDSHCSFEFNTHRRRRRDADATQLVTGAENWKLGHD